MVAFPLSVDSRQNDNAVRRGERGARGNATPSGNGSHGKAARMPADVKHKTFAEGQGKKNSGGWQLNISHILWKSDSKYFKSPCST